MPNRSRTVNRIKTDVKRAQKKIKEANETLTDLTRRLEELEVYITSSNEDIEQLQIGDKVIATSDPHRGRVGIVLTTSNYWVEVVADWTLIYKGKESKLFKKARKNLVRH